MYPERLEDAIEAGWKTGVELPGSDGLGHVGAMKMISDGSLNTRSAFCSMPYSDIFPDFYGTLSYAPDQIEAYFHVATCHGFAMPSAMGRTPSCSTRRRAHTPTVPSSTPRC